MGLPKEFTGFVREKVALAPLTTLGVGGAADFYAEPTNVEELAAFVRWCKAGGVIWRVLAGGSNVLVPDDGIRGAVIRLTAPAFRAVAVDGVRVRAGAGATLADAINVACKAGAAGLEALVGIPGTIGGAVRHNAGGRTGDIGQFVHSVEQMDDSGTVAVRMRADIRFGYRTSSLDDGIVLAVNLDLDRGAPEGLVPRIRKLWIEKNARQPFGFQRSAYAFRNPRGHQAVELIEHAGVKDQKVGGAELSARDPRYIIAAPGATSRDIRRLIDLVCVKVKERSNVTLDLQIDIW